MSGFRHLQLAQHFVSYPTAKDEPRKTHPTAHIARRDVPAVTSVTISFLTDAQAI